MSGTIRLFGFYRCFAAIFSFFARFLEVLLKMRAQISSQLCILAALQKTDHFIFKSSKQSFEEHDRKYYKVKNSLCFPG